MEEHKDILLAAYEHTSARFERIIKRLIILLILTVTMLFATNALWLYEWFSYDYTGVTVDSSDGGNANYLEAGANGVINNGNSDSQEENQEESE